MSIRSLPISVCSTELYGLSFMADEACQSRAGLLVSSVSNSAVLCKNSCSSGHYPAQHRTKVKCVLSLRRWHLLYHLHGLHCSFTATCAIIVTKLVCLEIPSRDLFPILRHTFMSSQKNRANFFAYRCQVLSLWDSYRRFGNCSFSRRSCKVVSKSLPRSRWLSRRLTRERPSRW